MSTHAPIIAFSLFLDLAGYYSWVRNARSQARPGGGGRSADGCGEEIVIPVRPPAKAKQNVEALFSL